ncbi:TPR-like protein [Stereum hirsutum FP-91666 SS1]|uniref:TPR-like protein n=1 Tax=Stereum hirsutum (strain FP-91666) TaxID=721885 RepID=UPI0004409E0B|nr:TPR-like protein [Stereum hirsutum FP-91666 SS1]EIM91096.1 TPR-like protein [Stereum hirsutum FP-91666 SS1]
MDAAGSTNPILVKLATAKEHKNVGDQAFKAGEVKQALQAYHMSLLYLQGIDKSGLQSALGGDSSSGDKTQEKTEADEMLEKIYANMAACHIKNSNWKRVLECVDKTLAKNPNNYKALFRRAKALGETGYFERAEKILEDIMKKSPADEPAAKAELARLRAMDKERERKHNQKLKGWLSRDKSALKDDTPESLVEQVKSAKIEELNDDA